MRPVALTFDAFAQMCSQAEQHRRPLPLQVQFRKRGEVLCGVVVDAKPAHGGSSVDFFQLRSQIGLTWCSHQNVRACAGVDGRCGCAAGAAVGDAPRAAPAAASGLKAPHGNTGVAL